MKPRGRRMSARQLHFFSFPKYVNPPQPILIHSFR